MATPFNDRWVKAGHRDWSEIRLANNQLDFKLNRPAQQQFDNFQDACDFNAQRLHEDWNDRPLYLALTGGMDSECSATTLVRNRIPFTPFILEVDELNAYEVWYAKYWCWKNSITPIVERITQDQIVDIYKENINVVRQTNQYGAVTVVHILDRVKAMGGYCITSAGDLYMHDTEKYFYTNAIDYPSNVFRTDEHPTAFFTYTPEIVLSYVLQFNLELDWQYNKCQFYGCAHRPKADYIRPIRYNDRMEKMIRLFRGKTPGTQPFVFGTKQQTIDFLLGKQTA